MNRRRLLIINALIALFLLAAVWAGINAPQLARFSSQNSVSILLPTEQPPLPPAARTRFTASTLDAAPRQLVFHSRPRPKSSSVTATGIPGVRTVFIPPWVLSNADKSPILPSENSQSFNHPVTAPVSKPFSDLGSAVENENGEETAALEPTPQVNAASEPVPQANAASEPVPEANAASEPTPQTSTASEPTPQASTASEPTPQANAASEPTPQANAASEPVPEANAASESSATEDDLDNEDNNPDLAPLEAPTPSQKPAQAAASSIPTQRPPPSSVIPPQGAENASIAALATEQVDPNFQPVEGMILLGVFTGRQGGRALIRTASQGVVTVTPGDKVEGWHVAAINATSLRLRRANQTRLLELPNMSP